MNPHRQKVLFILPNLHVGGAERVMVTLMHGLDRARFQPELLSFSAEGPLRAQIAPDIPFHTLHKGRVSRAIPGLYKQLKHIRPDVVVSTMAHVNFAMLLLRPFFPHTRFIVREAALPSMIFTSRPALVRFIKAAYRLLYPTADLVISPSRPVMEEFSNLNLSMKNHALLYNPVQIEKIRTAGRIGAPILNAARENKVHFIAAGQFYWPKGFDRLIEALQNIKMPYEWHLTILGDGRDRGFLESLIKDRHLENQVTLPGFLENPWPMYAEADCFLLSSRSEGMPNVALEALACGTPVIAHQEAGGITDVVVLAPASVTIASDMAGFIRAMEAVTPLQKDKMADSLLPDNFILGSVISQFSGFLESTAKEADKRVLGPSHSA